jgi:hypothetical protein
MTVFAKSVVIWSPTGLIVRKVEKNGFSGVVFACAWWALL